MLMVVKFFLDGVKSKTEGNIRTTNLDVRFTNPTWFTNIKYYSIDKALKVIHYLE